MIETCVVNLNLVILTICFESSRQKKRAFRYVFGGYLPKQIFNKSKNKNTAHFLFHYAIVLLTKSLISNGPSREAEGKSDRYPTQHLKVHRIKSEWCLYKDSIGSSRNHKEHQVAKISKKT